MDPGGPKVNAPQRGGISMNHKEPQVSQGLNLHALLQILGDPPLKVGHSRIMQECLEACGKQDQDLRTLV